MCKEHCGGAHPAYECLKKSTERKNKPVANGDALAASLGLKGMALSAKQAVDTNTRVEDDVGSRLLMSEAPETTSAGTVGNKDRQTTPKRGRGRPRTITDMKVYKAMKQREYRARTK